VIREHALYLYAECTKTDCPHRGSPTRNIAAGMSKARPD
jgi:hypothetical protein